ncbi:tRNA dihydrouridine synthase [Anatilimnocola sp. NA78]|uniref:tRNA dihydrouridine synthase n=1 Tax=Anatilimnocola sp. NA78 TaxID=3415683 RepID=UPI003CE4C630
MFPTDSAISNNPLPSLQIGKLKIGFPFVQAALSGYSDWPMRLIARRHGASYTLCEVMLDQFLVTFKDRHKNKHFLYLTDEERPVAGQLMGAEPEQFAQGAVRLAEAGFDVIDINFGCPVKKVLGRCRGGFHLSQPPVALEIIRRTRESVPAHIPVTVKMRRGLDDTQESRDNFFTIMEGAWQLGVDAITVHGRTVKQRYIGPSKWDFLTEVKKMYPQKTILGSGDLFTPADCLNMIQQTGVDGVTVARGCIGNPWIFSQCRALAAGQPLPPPPTLFEQRDVLREHFVLAEQLYGPQRAGPQMRKFGIKFAASHPQHLLVRESFARVKDLSEWEVVLSKWYAEDLPGCYPDPAVHRATTECGAD